jgi:putative PIN family toxin of toxin-antitoxin system
VISKKLNLRDPLLLTGKARLLFSTELIDEIELTISKPKLRRFFGTNGIDEMLTAFDPFINLIEVDNMVTIYRDPKDNFLLALAKDGKADILLTGDKDFLELKK